MCGHVTTPDIDLAYRHYRTKAQRSQFYCETCDDWIDAKPPPAPPDYPDDPAELF